MKTVVRDNGDLVAVSRSGQIAIADPAGRERERYKIPYGAVISTKDGAEVKGGSIIAKWDPLTHPIISEVAGRVSFSGMEDGLSIRRQQDEITGLSTIQILDPSERPSAGKDLKPAITLVDEKVMSLSLPTPTSLRTTCCHPKPFCLWPTAT